ncbi:MAG: nucleotide sugar dehydrogenase [Chloroflexi bacterium]|nr:nucleotide sugar dehydrogenase [Chloroflexota bacterium]
MRVSIFGLGYVGCVSAACLASSGHEVIGVDTDPIKLGFLREGLSPIVEPGLGDLIRTGVDAGRLRVTDDARAAVFDTDLSLVCVGTPSADNGSVDLRYARRVAEDIGRGLRDKDEYHLVVFRSTMLPGSVEDVLRPILEEDSGKQAGPEFGLAYNPEFLREGSSVSDFYHPPRTVIGELDAASGDLLGIIYADVEAPLVRTSIRTAEMVKYVDNAFHALKVTFANEIGALCKREALDSYEVMEIFALDTKLNLSPAYLKPGAAFGGSCLPKDLRALTQRARSQDLSVPLLESVLTSNERHKREALDLVLREGRRRVGVLGLSFKAGTDDLRESPTVELVEALIGKGYDVAIYDRNVSMSSIFGSNRAYIEREVPHISSLMLDSIDELMSRSDVLVVANRDAEFHDLPRRLRDDQTLIDLVRIPHEDAREEQYVGIAW